MEMAACRHAAGRAGLGIDAVLVVGANVMTRRAAILMRVSGGRGAGKTHLIKKIEQILRDDLWGGTIRYSDGSVVELPGVRRIEIIEIDRSRPENTE